MPWRRFRKKVERPIDVSKSIEESLEDAADGEEEEDLVELVELDDASITEAATLNLTMTARRRTDLGEKLRDALETDAPHRGAFLTRPLVGRLDRSAGAARSEDPTLRRVLIPSWR